MTTTIGWRARNELQLKCVDAVRRLRDDGMDPQDIAVKIRASRPSVDNWLKGNCLPQYADCLKYYAKPLGVSTKGYES